MTPTITASQQAVPQTAVPTAGTGSASLFGLLLIAEALLSVIPVIVLGAAIGWPASLGKPAATQLGGIAAHPAAVAWGYAVYLVYSMLIAPVMVGLAARTFGNLGSPLAVTVVVFGALSALARCIGILRWLTVMPVLAVAHAGADPALRLQLEWIFTGLTVYGGGIGEVLGVSLFMAAALGTLCVGSLVQGAMPRWLSGIGCVGALALLGLASPTFGGPQVVPVAAAVSLLSAWMLAAGLWTIRSRQQGAIV